jgi:acylphosphatase
VAQNDKKWLRLMKIAENEEGNEMADMACLSVTVCGRVQGVYFRYFVRNIARRLGLKGYVCNLASGDAVEVQAEGEKQQLYRLLEQLKVGPPGAWVKKVEVYWSDHSGQFTDFSVRY